MITPSDSAAATLAPGFLAPRSPCPHLPEARALGWRDLNLHRASPGPELYLTALTYAQDLWLRGFTARAILALDRALFCQLAGDEPVLREWPLPYRALAWVVRHHPGDTFMGNPRISFQHLAARARGPHGPRRRARAWAAWHLVRQARPDLPPDHGHAVAEPCRNTIRADLANLGHPGEANSWAALATEGPTVDPQVHGSA